MATVLLTWELGGGLGHVATLLPLAKGLCERGHKVFAAVRDLSQSESVFAGLRLSYLQAPIRLRRAVNRIDPPRTFAHILHNVGFGELGELRAMTDAWRNLYDYVKPDLIIFNHSPTALLAARGCEARRAVVGTGFCCPPDCCPLPDLRPWLGDNLERICEDESRVLSNVNRILDGSGEPALERLSQLYHQVDESFLTTFKELDHYPGRRDAHYWRACPRVGGRTPVWPEGQGKKVYAYVKPFPALPMLLGLLNELQCPTIVYTDGVDARLQRRFQSATLRFESTRLDLGEVGRRCDLAILNGNHGTTVSLLLAGRPMLQLPIYLEQALTADAVARLGAGLSAPPTKPEQIAKQLMALMSSDEYADGAHRFASHYAGFAPEEVANKMLQRVEELLS